MPVALYFKNPGFTPERYDEALKQLNEAGAGFGSVPGRRFHCAFDVNGEIHVFDVWDSMEQFQKFGEKLLPILGKLGLDAAVQPEIMKVHNVQNG